MIFAPMNDDRSCIERKHNRFFKILKVILNVIQGIIRYLYIFLMKTESYNEDIAKHFSNTNRGRVG